MKIISFSLWGNSKLYCQGAIDNIECAKVHYPDWKCRFYVAQNCPALPILQQMDCEVIEIMSDSYSIDREKEGWHWDLNHKGMMWRFYAISDSHIERVIFRDTDSRLSAREADAVREWEESGLLAHRMHEVKEHWNSLLMGGMWGIKGGLFTNIEETIHHYCNLYTKIRNEPWIFVDLWFLMDVIWPYIKESCLGHGYSHPNQFKIDGPMVGDVVHKEWRDEIFS